MMVCLAPSICLIRTSDCVSPSIILVSGSTNSLQPPDRSRLVRHRSCYSQLVIRRYAQNQLLMTKKTPVGFPHQQSQVYPRYGFIWNVTAEIITLTEINYPIRERMAAVLNVQHQSIAEQLYLQWAVWAVQLVCAPAENIQARNSSDLVLGPMQ